MGLKPKHIGTVLGIRSSIKKETSYIDPGHTEADAGVALLDDAFHPVLSTIRYLLLSLFFSQDHYSKEGFLVGKLIQPLRRT